MPLPDPFRAFCAVPLEEGAAAALEEAARGLLAGPPVESGGWRVVPAGRIHLTLKFLGDSPAGLRGDLGTLLREAARGTAPFAVSFGGWVPIPGPRDPRVLAVGVSDPAGSLRRLAAALEEGAAALGFPRESRPFLGHATVARRRRRGGGRRGGGARAAGTVPLPASGREDGPAGPGERPLASQKVGRIVLMKSELGPGGPTYEVLETLNAEVARRYRDGIVSISDVLER